MIRKLKFAIILFALAFLCLASTGWADNSGLGLSTSLSLVEQGGAISNPLWPFPDIPLPPFLRRPDLTGDYRNVGSDGAALDLSPAPDNPYHPQGYAPPLGSFSNGWVISNPSQDSNPPGESSVVIVPYNPDVSYLGSLFSMVFKVKFGAGGNSCVLGFSGSSLADIWRVYYNNYDFPLEADFISGDNVLDKQGIILLEAEVEYIIVVTFNSGVFHFYINGVEDTIIEGGASEGTLTSMPDTGDGVCIGDDSFYPNESSPDGTIFKAVAVHKGIAYTPAQAAEITAGLQ